jgi:hypothetical protein
MKSVIHVISLVCVEDFVLIEIYRHQQQWTHIAYGLN